MAEILGLIASPLDLLLITLMSGLPKWFVLSDISQLAAYPRQALVLTFWVVMAVNGVLAPIIEEMYFRGYLTGFKISEEIALPFAGVSGAAGIGTVAN